MRNILIAAASALIASTIAAMAVVTVNPQNCILPSVCLDIVANLLPSINSAALLSPGTIGTNTIANLGTTCTAAQKGQIWYVTDAAATPVYNATVAGAGAVIIPVFCNGTNWTNH